MPGKPEPPSPPGAETVCDLLTSTLSGLVVGRAEPIGQPPAEIKSSLDDLLKRPSTMRDGILALLAYAVAAGEPIDFRTQAKFRSARTVTQYLADDLLPRLHIAGKKDALQTGAKGIDTYFARKNAPWKATLGWASDQASIEPIERAFLYLAAGIAATARDLPAFPELDIPRLTFARVFSALDHLLLQPSHGAHEQLIFAALLESSLNQLGEKGVVETKHVFASDASAGTAADVQHKHGGQVSEAYEVTAGDWRGKVEQARDTLISHDLRHIHVLGSKVAGVSGDDLAEELPSQLDITVLELREEVRSLVARLDKPHRREALERLYELLVAKQSDDALVPSYVQALEARGLTEQL